MKMSQPMWCPGGDLVYIGKWVSAIERAPLRPFLPYGPLSESIEGEEKASISYGDASSYARIENPRIARLFYVSALPLLAVTSRRVERARS